MQRCTAWPEAPAAARGAGAVPTAAAPAAEEDRSAAAVASRLGVGTSSARLLGASTAAKVTPGLGVGRGSGGTACTAGTRAAEAAALALPRPCSGISAPQQAATSQLRPYGSAAPAPAPVDAQPSTASSLAPAELPSAYARLNEEQLTVVHERGSQDIFVTAGPGSGKTRTLVARVHALVVVRGGGVGWGGVFRGAAGVKEDRRAGRRVPPHRLCAQACHGVRVWVRAKACPGWGEWGEEGGGGGWRSWGGGGGHAIRHPSHAAIIAKYLAAPRLMHESPHPPQQPIHVHCAVTTGRHFRAPGSATSLVAQARARATTTRLRPSRATPPSASSGCCAPRLAGRKSARAATA